MASRRPLRKSMADTICLVSERYEKEVISFTAGSATWQTGESIKPSHFTIRSWRWCWSRKFLNKGVGNGARSRAEDNFVRTYPVSGVVMLTIVWGIATGLATSDEALAVAAPTQVPGSFHTPGRLPPDPFQGQESNDDAPISLSAKLIAGVQEILTGQGFATGTRDGRMTLQTIESIRSFQQAHGLVVDGTVSRPLLHLLQRLSDLVVAAAMGDEMRVQTHLDAGISPEARDLDGWPALMVAAFYGQLGVMRLLMERGARVEGASLSGHTPLMGALWSGKPEAVALLLAHGAAVDTVAPDGTTAQGIAQQSGNTALVRLLENRVRRVPISTQSPLRTAGEQVMECDWPVVWKQLSYPWQKDLARLIYRDHVDLINSQNTSNRRAIEQDLERRIAYLGNLSGREGQEVLLLRGWVELDQCLPGLREPAPGPWQSGKAIQ
ncbi:hypothetical protein CCP3SC15_1130010 [Gammaproteobacteria bacterium]